jgi:hypothetical protein
MDRTRRFLERLEAHGGRISPAHVLKNPSQYTFTEVSYKIGKMLVDISFSLRENEHAFVDRYGSILSRRSSMTDEQRSIFLSQTTRSLSSVESLIGQLAENVKTGKVRFSGNAIDHSIGVFAALDHRLRLARRDFQLLRAAREEVKIQMRPASVAGDVTEALRKRSPAPQVDPEFERMLQQEHDYLRRGLLDTHEQVIQAQAVGQEIAELHRIYNTMIAEQTAKIRILREDIERATEDYQKGTEQLDILAKRSKYQHLWISIVVSLLAFMLLFKELRFHT